MLVDTARDPRPFYVQTPQGRLQALGTRFSVRLERDLTFLAVYQGSVAIHPAAARTRTVIDAGQQVRFSREAIAASEEADPAREAWALSLIHIFGPRLRVQAFQTVRVTHRVDT